MEPRYSMYFRLIAWCIVWNYDAMVLHSSAMMTMLSVLYINDDPNCPVKTVTDKTYGISLHFCPFHTDAGLRMMNNTFMCCC
jgi:hypothetical protein